MTAGFVAGLVSGPALHVRVLDRGEVAGGTFDAPAEEVGDSADR
ncbi:hypothetical protein FHU41_000100 [Psychromicrobium silvestre]|uniref:Uncharacterized protein n=1 Tax=Psychromicrobium silvestre TaxID=1645614 RepID=A0A7Y9LQT0_9MICC|nr:hypothetical protein [Psychromicrobium silvestre]NYE93879.1 hypothetical protein [Psychromicrobium silvestre]